ncbi:type VI secretion system secreted protein VgrG [Pseudomonas costantinii]|uniref:Type VI secretion system secreted protein VgrG n=1 Tax=Pseudomonas costantinii TaxID=168469 RepID=A0A1H5G1Q4_9PSED|nr:type VI secretion system secreted protein VgrG [Pseudomonas costantinii]
MFAPANQSAFTLTLDGGPIELKVFEFKGAEIISQPYRFDLELVSEQPDLDLESLLHRQAYLGFDDQGHGIHGLVCRVAQGDSGRRLTRYQISLVPQLAYLKHSSHQRIFQHKTVPQIVAQVLVGQGIQSDRFEFRLSGTYPAREYCVQFGETDLAFIQRLCAELGIHYHFQHSPEGHLLVFGDDQTVFAEPDQPTPYTAGSGMVAGTPAIKRFTVQLQTRTTAVNLRDYDFRKPRLGLESAVAGEQLPNLEEQDYPGGFSDRPHGKYLAQRGLERHRSDYRIAHGEGDEPALVSGRFLKLSGHSREGWNDLWLVTQVTHEGKQPQVLEEAVTEVSGGDFRQGYRNEFVAAPWDVIFRPPLPEQPRPTISGYQNAVVTGPANSEIHCDEYGRVKVQMAWDRNGKHDDHSSCWLRVASGWAHDRYGSVLIPRVGMEVLVGFVNGDLDMPLVVGCLPNAATPVPLDLPAAMTRSIFRSQSSPGGGGYNELRIEDRKGAEEIYLRAQRDWTQHVLHDQQVQVDNQRRVKVGGESHHELRGEEQRITHGNRLTELKQDDHLVVGGSQQMRAGRTIQIGAGQSVVIDAGATVTIQAGGQSITLSAGGIFSSVPIQLGGAPAPTAAPVMPGIKEKLLAVIPAPLSPVQVTSLRRSAPFCEECERCKNGQCDLTQHGGKGAGATAGKTSGVEPGFHIVQRAMSRDALEKSLFESPSAIVLERFRSLNPQLTQYTRPGQMLVLSDPLNSQCTREEALLMEAAQEVNEALKPMSDDEAAFMVEHQQEIGAFLAQSSMAVGVGSSMVASHLTRTQSILVDIEKLHVKTFKIQGNLQGAEFLAERKRLLTQLDNSLGPLVRKGVGIADHPKLKSVLGISSRSLVHHWSKAGVSEGIPGYATHIRGVARASQYMKVGGFVGIGLGASASALKVRETCRVGSEDDCQRVKYTEGGNFVGSAGGGG